MCNTKFVQLNMFAIVDLPNGGVRNSCPGLSMIVSFASSKGGVGKSTTCAAIGTRLALRGDQVLIVDLDQKKTIERCVRTANSPGLTLRAIEREHFASVSGETVEAGGTDHILIDLADTREATAFKAI